MLDEETIDEALGLIGEAKGLIQYAIENSDSEEVKKVLKQAIDNLKEALNEIKGDHNIKCYSCGAIFHKPEQKEEFTKCPTCKSLVLVRVEQ